MKPWDQARTGALANCGCSHLLVKHEEHTDGSRGRCLVKGCPCRRPR